MSSSTVANSAMASASPSAAARAGTSAAALAIKQRNNELAMAYFAGFIGGCILLFAAFRLIGVWSRRRSSKEHSSFVRGFSALARRIRSINMSRVYLFPTFGHAVLYVIYVAINFMIAFYNVDWSAGTIYAWAKRMGWVTAPNLALVTFLALRNTPLAFLTAYSYERLKPLHKLAGFTTVCSMIIHASSILRALVVQKHIDELTQMPYRMGPVAGCSLIATLLTAVFLRRWKYELWYIIHVCLFMVIIIAVGLHRPDPSGNTLWIPIFAGSIWVIDRSIRLGRMAWYAPQNYATITPLPQGGSRIVLSRPVGRAAPGSHIYLWIPAIRAIETHPFTISSTNPVELVVNSRNGFTRSLHNYALQNPGAKLRASMDGPYGTLPNFALYDRLILIAGGSGASFTFGVALDLIKKLNGSSSKKIDFIWVVREKEILTWFTPSLRLLADSPLVNLRLHVSNMTSTQVLAHSSVHTAEKHSPILPSDIDSAPVSPMTLKTALQETAFPTINDIEKGKHVQISTFSISSSSGSKEAASFSLPESLTLHHDRPIISQLIDDAIAETGEGDKIMISACGPTGLMRDTRREAVRILAGGRRSVEVYLEQFKL